MASPHWPPQVMMTSCSVFACASNGRSRGAAIAAPVALSNCLLCMTTPSVLVDVPRDMPIVFLSAGIDEARRSAGGRHHALPIHRETQDRRHARPKPRLDPRRSCRAGGPFGFRPRTAGALRGGRCAGAGGHRPSSVHDPARARSGDGGRARLQQQHRRLPGGRSQEEARHALEQGRAGPGRSVHRPHAGRGARRRSTTTR